jgi:hypothetical protein
MGMPKYARIDVEIERYDSEGRPIAAVVTTEDPNGAVEKIQLSGASGPLKEMLVCFRQTTASHCLPELKVNFDSSTRTVEGTWVYPNETQAPAFKSVDGPDGRFGIEGEITLTCNPVPYAEPQRSALGLLVDYWRAFFAG